MKSATGQFKIAKSDKLNKTTEEVSVLLAAAEVARACYVAYQDRNETLKYNDKGRIKNETE